MELWHVREVAALSILRVIDVIGKAAEGGGMKGEAASKEQRQEDARRRDGLYEIRQELLKCVARRKCLENTPAVRALLKGGEDWLNS